MLFRESYAHVWLIQVRTWLQELLNMALLQGRFDTGYQMHDIIRQYCISRCSNPFIFSISLRLPAIFKFPSIFNLA